MPPFDGARDGQGNAEVSEPGQSIATAAGDASADEDSGRGYQDHIVFFEMREYARQNGWDALQKLIDEVKLEWAS